MDYTQRLQFNRPFSDQKKIKRKEAYAVESCSRETLRTQAIRAAKSRQRTAFLHRACGLLIAKDRLESFGSCVKAKGGVLTSGYSLLDNLDVDALARLWSVARSWWLKKSFRSRRLLSNNKVSPSGNFLWASDEHYMCGCLDRRCRDCQSR